MPTYSYACTECDNRFDVVQSFTDDTLTTCEKCSGRLRKLFNSVGVVFKGSGFYRTDSRESGKKSSSSNGSSSKDSGSSEKSSSSESSSSSDKSASSEKSSSSSTASAASTPS
ncbi:FmdB family zinc ribbon protein [Mycobacterium rhizamassiliense]|uniref:FmdB family zinc ribbon protein n=1 Tax=Mycobacterium rhizamassiliense TaxID=1841860 RepID=UPI00097D8618|nr:FmdB family zinc ribbon protein [Mycobacterium rhizamassiliense]